MDPPMSLLFLKISRLAPTKRCASIQVCATKSRPAYLLKQQTSKFGPADIDALSVRGIHYPDQSVGLFEVVLPVRSQGLLTAHIPSDSLVVEQILAHLMVRTDVQFVANNVSEAWNTWFAYPS
ncbi:hypothetical protein MRB53_036841 [Persea americana]|nr:hypothetical protein MRB53_036841 [Persea americana]